jgi:hypothetical protein
VNDIFALLRKYDIKCYLRHLIKTVGRGISSLTLRKEQGVEENIWTEESWATGGWREQHEEELHNSYFSPSISKVMKSSRMRWAEHVGRTGPRGMRLGYWWESQKEREH